MNKHDKIFVLLGFLYLVVGIGIGMNELLFTIKPNIAIILVGLIVTTCGVGFTIVGVRQ